MPKKPTSENFYIFSKRLSAIMKEKKLKQQDLADCLGVKRQTISLYMNGNSMPDAEQIKNIALFFGVSADWLLGLSDNRTLDADLQAVCNYTGLNEPAISVFSKAKTAPINDNGDFMRFVSASLSDFLFLDLVIRLYHYRSTIQSEIISDLLWKKAFFQKKDRAKKTGDFLTVGDLRRSGITSEEALRLLEELSDMDEKVENEAKKKEEAVAIEKYLVDIKKASEDNIFPPLVRRYLRDEETYFNSCKTPLSDILKAQVTEKIFEILDYIKTSSFESCHETLTENSYISDYYDD